MSKNKNQPTDEAKPEDVVTEEVTDKPTDEPKPEDALSDVPSFRLGKPDQLLSEMSYEELLAEAQRYHLVEQAGNEMLAEKENKIAELQAELDALKSGVTNRPTDGIVDGPPHGVLIKLIRPVGRADIKAGVGDIIGEIIMAEDCGDFNFMVDAIRNGFAGEA